MNLVFEALVIVQRNINKKMKSKLYGIISQFKVKYSLGNKRGGGAAPGGLSGPPSLKYLNNQFHKHETVYNLFSIQATAHKSNAQDTKIGLLY